MFQPNEESFWDNLNYKFAIPLIGVIVKMYKFINLCMHWIESCIRISTKPNNNPDIESHNFVAISSNCR